MYQSLVKDCPISLFIVLNTWLFWRHEGRLSLAKANQPYQFSLQEGDPHKKDPFVAAAMLPSSSLTPSSKLLLSVSNITQHLNKDWMKA